MADIRCDKCGKLNPSTLEVCQYCNTRLRLSWSPGQQDDDSLNGGLEGEETIPEWLRDLRGPELSDTEATPEKPKSSSADWLSSVEGSEAFDEKAVGGVFDLKPEENLEDWLSGASKVDEPEAPQAEELSFDQDRGEVGFMEEPAASETGPEEAATFDWLERTEAGSAPEPGLPGAFQGETAETPAEGLPDWLSRMQPSEPADWTQPTQPENLSPAWMEDQPAEPGGTGEEAAEPGPEETAPEPSADGGEASAEPEPATGYEEPDLSSIFSPGPEPAPAEKQEEMPDWLTSLYTQPEETQSTQPPAENIFSAETESPTGEESGLPAWITSEARYPAEEVQPESPAEEAAGEAEGLPDWLADLQGQIAQDTGEPAPRGITPAFTSIETGELGNQEEIPEWLSNIEKAGSQPPAVDEGATFAFEEGKISPFTEGQPSEEGTEAEGAQGLPDWITEVSSEAEPGMGVPSEETEASAALSAAELPNWLEAMRPMETGEPITAFKDTSDNTRTEKSGPLSGLSGVLPVGAHIVRPRKPVVFTLKLQVNEELQNRALLLQKLIEDEATPKPIAQPAFAPVPYLIRIALAAILMAAIVFALWTGGQSVPLPSGEQIPTMVRDVHQQITALPRGSVVLLAVEYEPGFAGEIDRAAQAVVGHLVRQGVVVAAVSTTPSGPALAERLFQAARNQPGGTQVDAGQFLNLGYLPGGLAGLYGFAQAPEQILPFDLQGKPAWEAAPLDAQKGLGSFAMLVVITENADTARNWIEQVGPALGSSPMLMVLSAQAEPMTMPYYTGTPQQVKGIVAGLAGGASYESLVNQRGPAAQAWDAYSISLTASVAMLLLGGLLSALTSALVHSRQNKVEGQA